MAQGLIQKPLRAAARFGARSPEHRLAPVLAAATLLSAALAGGALFMQHVIGIPPCQLCYIQRQGHYAMLALGLAGLALMALNLKPRRLADLRAALLFAGGLGFLHSGAWGVFHSGVERGLWEGLPGCSAPSGGIPESVAALGNLLAEGEAFVPCGEIPWSFLGLSMANYNALVSLAAAGFLGWIVVAYLKTRTVAPRPPSPREQAEQHG